MPEAFDVIDPATWIRGESEPGGDEEKRWFRAPEGADRDAHWLRKQIRGWADEVLERRDSAILLLGFAGAFRRSELSELVCGDVTVHRHDGLHVRMRKSKTDQEGRGAVKALSYTGSHETCPPCAHIRWIRVVAAFGRRRPPVRDPTTAKAGTV